QRQASRFQWFGTKLEYTYITPRIMAMPIPYDPSSRRRAEGGNPIQEIAKFLNEQHGGHYMIWNVSEESYDYSLFNDQVLEYKVLRLRLCFACFALRSWPQQLG